MGASPNFLLSAFISTSKRLRAFFQASFARGTWQSPCPLQVFSPGFSPQPPCPLHSFEPPQECFLTVAQAPVPAQLFFLSAPLPLQVFNPRADVRIAEQRIFFRLLVVCREGRASCKRQARECSHREFSKIAPAQILWIVHGCFSLL